ncbi:hypothetical protein IB236_17500 [Acidovorax sp. ACV02]|uniref:hypothetical protein n=1 Tax=Acidovorax sp. ACV02 TaxID=2769310 RepID=UPI00177F5228|nr:hypothetical protein [Acidovorax sp. ACV02]MBD9407144.1 hypothetical protein [Acidovorax sp. ACV02]
MPLSKDAILTAAATIAAAKIQVGGVLAAAAGEKTAQAAAKAGVDGAAVLRESINEVLKTVKYVEEHKVVFDKWQDHA